MAKPDLKQLVTTTLLNDTELSKVEKLARRDEGVAKLLTIHNAFRDEVVYKPLLALLAHVEFVNQCVASANQYVSGDGLTEINIGTDDEPEMANVTTHVALMINKSNAIPERLKDMVKELRGLTEDILSLVNSCREINGGKIVDQDELNSFKSSGMSWTDWNSEKNRKKKA